MLTPSSIQQCQHASVTVTVAVTCPAARPIHLIVAVDRSRSIEPLLATVRRSARDILAELDWAIPGTQVAVLSHGFKVTVETDWTNQASRAQGALNGIRFDPGDLGEDPPLAIDTAARMFERARTDADGRHLNPIEVLVLYGDGLALAGLGTLLRLRGRGAARPEGGLDDASEEGQASLE